MSRKSPILQNKLEPSQLSIFNEFPTLIEGLTKLFVKAITLIEEAMPSLVEITAQVEPIYIEPLDRFVKGFKSVQLDFSGYQYSINKFQTFLDNLKNIDSGNENTSLGDSSSNQKATELDIIIEMLMVNQLKFRHIEENMSKFDDDLKLFPQKIGTTTTNFIEKIAKENNSLNIALIEKLGTLQSVIDEQIKISLGIIELTPTKTELQTSFDLFENRQNNALKLILKDLFQQQANQFYQDMMIQISDGLTKAIETQLSTLVEKLSESQKSSGHDIIDVSRFKTSENISAQTSNGQLNLSADLEEMKRLLNFFSGRPTDKQQCIAQIEETRDILLTQRKTEAPYRVTASTIFREALVILSREDKVVQLATNRKIVELLDKLFEYIASSS